MKKSRAIEELTKKAIRDQLAVEPTMSIDMLRVNLLRCGFQTSSGRVLDWHYVSKLVKTIRLENLTLLQCESPIEKIILLKERHRTLAEQLLKIARGDGMRTTNGIVHPSHRERIIATNSILRWEFAMVDLDAYLLKIKNTSEITETASSVKELRTVE